MTCTATWYNDTEFENPEIPHVHRCNMPQAHNSYHECGYTYRVNDQELYCGIGF